MKYFHCSACKFLISECHFEECVPLVKKCLYDDKKNCYQRCNWSR